MENMLGAVLGLFVVWLADKFFGAKGAAAALVALLAGTVLLGGLDLFGGKGLFDALMRK